jgi:hypothetical protein
MKFEFLADLRRDPSFEIVSELSEELFTRDHGAALSALAEK